MAITYAIESTKFSNLDYKNCSMHAPGFYPVKISESLPWLTWKADIYASSLAILPTEVQYLNSKNRHMFECIGGLEHLHSWDYNTINHIRKFSDDGILFYDVVTIDSKGRQESQ